MKRKGLITYILILAVFLAAFPSQAASGVDMESTVLAGDGWRITVTVTEITTRATEQKIGVKEYKCTSDSDGALLWTITLTGTFAYTGFSSTCVKTECKVTTYASDWYEVTHSTSQTGSTASCAVTMGRKA